MTQWWIRIWWVIPIMEVEISISTSMILQILNERASSSGYHWCFGLNNEWLGFDWNGVSAPPDAWQKHKPDVTHQCRVGAVGFWWVWVALKDHPDSPNTININSTGGLKKFFLTLPLDNSVQNQKKGTVGLCYSPKTINLNSTGGFKKISPSRER